MLTDYSDGHNQVSYVIGMCSVLTDGDVIQSGKIYDVVDNAMIG
jgi:hypothetical protein